MELLLRGSKNRYRTKRCKNPGADLQSAGGQMEDEAALTVCREVLELQLILKGVLFI